MQKIISIWFCKYIYRCHYTGLFSCEPPPASLSRLLLSISWEGPAQNLFLSVIAWTFFDDFFSLTDMSDEKIPAYLLNLVLADFSTRKITSSLDFDNNNWFFRLNVSPKLAWCCLEHFKSNGYSVRKQIVTDQQAGRKTNFVWNSMPVFFFQRLPHFSPPSHREMVPERRKSSWTEAEDVWGVEDHLWQVLLRRSGNHRSVKYSFFNCKITFCLGLKKCTQYKIGGKEQHKDIISLIVKVPKITEIQSMLGFNNIPDCLGFHCSYYFVNKFSIPELVLTSIFIHSGIHSDRNFCVLYLSENNIEL